MLKATYKKYGYKSIVGIQFFTGNVYSCRSCHHKAGNRAWGRIFLHYTTPYTIRHRRHSIELQIRAVKGKLPTRSTEQTFPTTEFFDCRGRKFQREGRQGPHRNDPWIRSCSRPRRSIWRRWQMRRHVASAWWWKPDGRFLSKVLRWLSGFSPRCLLANLRLELPENKCNLYQTLQIWENINWQLIRNAIQDICILRMSYMVKIKIFR